MASHCLLGEKPNKMTWVGSLVKEGWRWIEVLSLCALGVLDCCWASAACFFWSCFIACSKPSKAGWSFLAGVAVLDARDELLRTEDFPKGPFSSGCRRWPRAFGCPLWRVSATTMSLAFWMTYSGHSCAHGSFLPWLSSARSSYGTAWIWVGLPPPKAIMRFLLACSVANASRYFWSCEWS